jgi:hypothetical protein
MIARDALLDLEGPGERSVMNASLNQKLGTGVRKELEAAAYRRWFSLKPFHRGFIFGAI